MHNAFMDVLSILAQLREELAQPNEAIMAIERLAAGEARKRGRPAKWLVEARAANPKVRPRSAGPA
jgi:hypothetical protein